MRMLMMHYLRYVCERGRPGVGAVRVGEENRHHFPTEFGERPALSSLVGELEIPRQSYASDICRGESLPLPVLSFIESDACVQTYRNCRKGKDLYLTGHGLDLLQPGTAGTPLHVPCMQWRLLRCS